MKYTPKPKPCKNESCDNMFTPRFRTTEQFCSKGCEIQWKNSQEKPTPKPIRKVSKKRAKENPQYSKKRKEFLQKPENSICPVTGQRATQVHHKMGRYGYADKFARDNGITLFLDDRFWLGVSDDGHKKIERNPEWAKNMGYSLERLADYDA